MIEWTDQSDRGSRFYSAELRPDEPVAVVDVVRAMFEFVSERILGVGNARNFDVLMFEVNCDTGRLIAGASTDDGWQNNRTDGCSIRVQEVQDYWYDLLDAGVEADVFSQSIEAKVTEIGNVFKQFVGESVNKLRPKAGTNGFKLVVYGSDPGKAVFSESYA